MKSQEFSTSLYGAVARVGSDESEIGAAVHAEADALAIFCAAIRTETRLQVHPDSEDPSTREGRAYIAGYRSGAIWAEHTSARQLLALIKEAPTLNNNWAALRDRFEGLPERYGGKMHAVWTTAFLRAVNDVWLDICATLGQEGGAK